MATKKEKKVKWVKLFAYGTLQTGCRLHGWLGNNDELAQRVGTATICGFSLIDFGPYPGLVAIDGRQTEGFQVEGEVWLVHPTLFKEIRSMEERVGYTTITVNLNAQENIEAYAFLFASFKEERIRWVPIASNKLSSKKTEHIIKV